MTTHDWSLIAMVIAPAGLMLLIIWVSWIRHSRRIHDRKPTNHKNGVT